MSRRVLSVVAMTAVGAALAVVPIVSESSSSASSVPYAYCPAARQIISSHTHWHERRIASGITLSQANVGTGRQRLHINVVRADLRNKRVAVRPLRRTLTHREPLTSLARRKRLVAAANGPYFSFATGSPAVPVIGPGGPLVLTDRAAWLAGIGTNSRAEDGNAWLDGAARSAWGRHRLVAINWARPLTGLAVYTSAWGGGKVPMLRHSRTLAVRHGVGIARGRHRVPRGGELLVANGRQAEQWLRRLHHGSRVSIRYHAADDAPSPFREAYGVGTLVVDAPDHVRVGLYCSRGEKLAARTDFAWRAHGKQLIIATVDSPRGSEGVGVDEDQMSQIMATLGAGRSYALDGGGSTELVTRTVGSKLSLRTARHRGHLRSIPIGIGIYSLPTPKPKHRKVSAPSSTSGSTGPEHPSQPGEPKKPQPSPTPTDPGLLGGILNGLFGLS